MPQTIIETIKKEIRNQTTVPYLGMGIFAGIKTKDGERRCLMIQTR